MAVFAETRIPAPLDFKYLVYFQTNPRTQVWSLGFGHYTLGRSPVKDTVAWWKHLMMEMEEDKSGTGMPPFQESTRDITEGHAQMNEEVTLLGHKES